MLISIDHVRHMPYVKNGRRNADMATTTSTPDAKAVLELIKEKGIQMVDMRFTDLPGAWQHFTIPANMLTEDEFQDGLGFDGSSIRGFQVINESDMLVFPDPSTAFVDPAL